MDVLGHVSALVAGVGVGAVGFVLIGVIGVALFASTVAILHRK